MGAARDRRLLERIAAGDDLFAFSLGKKCVPSLGEQRRRRERAAMPDTFDDFDRFVLAEAKAACRRRQKMTGYGWAIDHMVPLSRGGRHAFDNIQVIPAWLNGWKGDRLVLTGPGEWVAHLPGSGGLL